MDADSVVKTLAELEAERSGDPHLLRALARRFHDSAEEFFPPQIDALLGHFAALGFSDDHLLEGFAGRLDDVASGASPRRLVRLMRHGASLRLRPEAWLDHVLREVRGHLPNFEHGVPALLAALAELGPRRDTELAELLLTQGLLNAERLGDGYLSRLFECWSRHWLPHGEVEEKAAALATGDASAAVGDGDLRDGLNLLAGLLRCDRGGEASLLEERLEARIRAASAEEAVAALCWMRRLAVQSGPLWLACADAVEVALGDPAFVRDRLPDAIHALAALAGRGAGAAADAGLVAGLLRAPETAAALPRRSASQALQMLHAACLLGAASGGPAAGGAGAAAGAALLPLGALATQATRLSRQLTLPERRTLRLLAEVVHAGHSEGPELAARLEAARCLPAPPLPPLVDTEAEADWAPVEVGAESLLVRPNDAGEQKRGARFLAFGDVFAGPRPSEDSLVLAPSCSMLVRSLELQGWQVDMRVRASE
ncbi:unnamed protein product [Prorocentrum cordatum]|uniref:Uncharacterized protein n=1 Tax=Prorocentrum cordatum TaxID=2364126 RepID=A0ABN9V0N2_9DINO|nr:unnamed protein product [Polarella glacialis]